MRERVNTTIRGVKDLGGNDFLKRPSGHPFTDPHDYIRGKRVDDGIPSHLWRVHDRLYDLDGFQHPGGDRWLPITMGTDVTELFESHHINMARVQKTLAPFEVAVEEALGVGRELPRRLSPFTFHPDGFYCTLRGRVWDRFGPAREAREGALSARDGGHRFDSARDASGSAEPGSKQNSSGAGAGVVSLGPSPESKLLADTLVLVSILGTFMAGQSTYLPASVLFTVATGLVNGLFIGVGHNFLHQAEAFRHHYLDLSGFNSADFRAHHAVSHHPYTNTVADVELNFALPAVNFFPEEAGRRPLRQRVGQRVALALRNGLGTPALQIGRLAKTLTGRLAGGAGGSRPADKVAALIPAAQIAALAGLQGSLAAGCWRWILMLMSTSNLFLWMNYLTGPHFNDQCWHQGDTLDDRDWGIVQVQTNTERAGLPQDGSLRSNLLNIPTFGLHHLHHLFPTVDAYELSRIMPLFEETCREFGVEFSLMDNYELSNGLWRLLDGVRPSTRTRNGLRMKARL